MRKKGIAILGSTGSIGTQALDVIAQHREKYSVELLTANRNSELLIKQAIEFDANTVIICDKSKYKEVNDALSPHDIKVFAGIESVQEAVCVESIDTVLTAMVGFSGLRPTVAAIKAGKTIALANKETLVAAGEIISRMCIEHRTPVIPVDSEHSAIFQSLQGEYNPIEKILLTASGGPFLHSSEEEIRQAGIEDVLKHPRWKMGAKVTVDSASMMNKGLEMIEARWLFNTDPSKIEIIVHPQSVIHSMVQFEDGSIIAQMSHPDMRIPIQYGIAYPERPALNTKRLDFSELGKMTFEKPDTGRFPAIEIAYGCIRKGGNMPCIMNAANEAAVAAFLNGKIKFHAIPEIISSAIGKAHFLEHPDLEDIFGTHEEVYRKTASCLGMHNI